VLLTRVADDPRVTSCGTPVARAPPAPFCHHEQNSAPAPAGPDPGPATNGRFVTCQVHTRHHRPSTASCTTSHARTPQLWNVVTGVRAVINADQPDYLADIYAASEHVYALLALPRRVPAHGKRRMCGRSRSRVRRSSTPCGPNGPSTSSG